MTKGLMILALAVALACAGCAERRGATPAEVTPARPPQGAPQAPKSKPDPAVPPVAGTGSDDPSATPAGVAAAAGATNATSATSKAPTGEAPPAIASAYVYSPQQAVSSAPSAIPAPSPDGGPPAAPSKPASPAPATAPGELQLQVVASAAQVATGEVVSVDVMASSSAAVVDAPLHLSFDPNVVEFVDGAPGEFLTQGGSSVVFLAEGRSRPGDVAIALGRVAREHGASGSGLLCRVHFRGVAAGTTSMLVGQAKAWGIEGQELTVRSAGTTVVVR